MTHHNILVVEDNLDQAQLLAETVEEMPNTTAIQAYNGIDALDIIHQNERLLGFAQNKIDCILLDLRMPKMNGLQFLEHLRKQEKKKLFTNYIPVVLITAHEDLEKWDSAIKHDVAGYLLKPWDAATVKDILNRILNKWETEVLVRQAKEKGVDRKKELFH